MAHGADQRRSVAATTDMIAAVFLRSLHLIFRQVIGLV